MRLLILDETKNALEGDTELRRLSSGVPEEVRAYSGRADRDPLMPYIVYAVLIRYSADHIATGHLLIDVWDYGRSSLRLEMMAERVRRIFHRTRIAGTSIRFILHTDDTIRDFTRNNGSIRNNQEQVFQDSVQFTIRGWDPGLADQAIISQPYGNP